MLCLVSYSSVHPGRFRSPALQRAGSMECGHQQVGQHYHRCNSVLGYDVCFAQEDRSDGIAGTNHAGAGQCSVSALCGSNRTGNEPENPIAVPAVIFTQSQFDRTTLEVHQKTVSVRTPLRNVQPSSAMPLTIAWQKSHRTIAKNASHS